MSLNTVKGNVAPTERIHKMNVSSEPANLSPRYRVGRLAECDGGLKVPRFDAVVDSVVNYSILGADGFEILSRVIDGADSYDFEYSDLAKSYRLVRRAQCPTAITNTPSAVDTFQKFARRFSTGAVARRVALLGIIAAPGSEPSR